MRVKVDVTGSEFLIYTLLPRQYDCQDILGVGIAHTSDWITSYAHPTAIHNFFRAFCYEVLPREDYIKWRMVQLPRRGSIAPKLEVEFMGDFILNRIQPVDAEFVNVDTDNNITFYCTVCDRDYCYTLYRWDDFSKLYWQVPFDSSLKLRRIRQLQDRVHIHQKD
jgi:hypothetical protein